MSASVPSLFTVAGAAALSLLFAAGISAQKLYGPASQTPWTSDLNTGTNTPFSRQDARLIDLYTPAELGTTTSGGVASFTVNGFAWRYDANTSSASSKSLTIKRLIVRMGVTRRNLLDITADINCSLTEKLTTVVDIQNYKYQPNYGSTANPRPWGGPGGQFHFTLKSPLKIDIPLGGCFVVESVVVGGEAVPGNGNHLDFVVSDADKTTATFGVGGLGCPANATGIPLGGSTHGNWVPGGAVSAVPRGLAPFAPAVLFLSSQLITPTRIPQTQPACTLYIDPTRWIQMLAVFSDGAGNVPLWSPGSIYFLPRDSALCGIKAYSQWVALVPKWSGNRVGVQLSNYVWATTGCLSSNPNLRSMTLFHCCHPPYSHTGRYASQISYAARAIAIY